MLIYLPVIIAAVLFLLGASASANMMQQPSGGSSGYQGPGDVVSTGATWRAWYGHRAFSHAAALAAAPAFQLKRNGDNETCDWHVTASGVMSTIVGPTCSGADSGALVGTFCAGAGSTHCYESLAYDQTGHGETMGGGAVPNSPEIVQSCPAISYPCAKFNSAVSGGYQAWAHSFASAINQPYMVSMIVLVSGVTNSGRIITNDTATIADASWDNAAVYFYMAAPTGFPSANGSLVDNQFYRIQAVYNGASCNIRVAGVDKIGTCGTNPLSNPSSVVIGAAIAESPAPFDGEIEELGITDTVAPTGPQLTALDANMGVYIPLSNGISATCGALQTDYSFVTGCNAVALPLLR